MTRPPWCHQLGRIPDNIDSKNYSINDLQFTVIHSNSTIISHVIMNQCTIVFTCFRRVQILLYSTNYIHLYSTSSYIVFCDRAASVSFVGAVEKNVALPLSMKDKSSSTEMLPRFVLRTLLQLTAIERKECHFAV